MKNNINLTEILKGCKTGTELYSSTFGELIFIKITGGTVFPILCAIKNKNGREGTVKYFFTEDGRYSLNGECVLFPSKDLRDWSKFNFKKFDPNTLKPFDRVLVSDEYYKWSISLFSYYDSVKKKSICSNYSAWTYCIPYNEETKHLVGTEDQAPEYYRYWED